MGNKTSSNQEVDYGALPGDLLDLKDAQFKFLWNQSPLTAEQVTQAARSMKGNNSNCLTGLYDQEEESDEALLAVHLVRLLPELAALRFRLVPSRLKENRFWQATFALLRERLVEYNARLEYQEDTADTSTDDDGNSNNNQNESTTLSENKHHVVTANGTTAHHPSKDLARQIKAKDVEIAKLQRQIKELQELLAESSRNGQSHSKKNPKHKGVWKMERIRPSSCNTPRRSRRASEKKKHDGSNKCKMK